MGLFVFLGSCSSTNDYHTVVAKHKKCFVVSEYISFNAMIEINNATCYYYCSRYHSNVTIITLRGSTIYIGIE